jgi:hypothetical protein
MKSPRSVSPDEQEGKRKPLPDPMINERALVSIFQNFALPFGHFYESWPALAQKTLQQRLAKERFQTAPTEFVDNVCFTNSDKNSNR